MKKIVCILLAIISLLTFTACGGDGEEGTQEGKAAFSLPYKDQIIKIDSRADAIVSALGEPKRYEELPTCGVGDLDKLYNYGSIRIRTYQLNGIDYISLIELMDDLVETAEGISIGSQKDSVAQKYGKADKETATAWIYNRDGMDLEIHFHTDGTVKSIVYRGEN